MAQKNFLLSFLFSILGVPLWAQTSVIEGKVTTSDGNPAEFVNIILVGTNRGTLVGADGHYKLDGVKPGTYILRASLVGLITQNQTITVEAGKTAQVDFVLPENSEELKEVVVTANPSKYVTDYPSVSLRLKTSLLEVPQNIQVVTKQIIQDQQIFDMLEGITRS
jgi:iron complex outermembrane receptor protein